jgi:hypothetical protein
MIPWPQHRSQKPDSSSSTPPHVAITTVAAP